MPCHTIKVDGTVAIICTSRGRQKRCACGRPARYLCDWKLGGGKTCDRPICAVHAEEVAKDKHLCVDHQAAYARWLDARREKVVALRPESSASDLA